MNENGKTEIKGIIEVIPVSFVRTQRSNLVSNHSFHELLQLNPLQKNRHVIAHTCFSSLDHHPSLKPYRLTRHEVKRASIPQEQSAAEPETPKNSKNRRGIMQKTMPLLSSKAGATAMRSQALLRLRIWGRRMFAMDVGEKQGQPAVTTLILMPPNGPSNRERSK